MANEWTTEYPTKPGYYWVRNRICRVDDKWQKYEEPLPLHVVEIVSDGELYDTGSEVGRDRSDIVSAEWYGPIQPPQENDIAPLIDAAVHILNYPPPPLPTPPPDTQHEPGMPIIEDIVYQ